jgi:predicted amino acid-binding ACT domain protein
MNENTPESVGDALDWLHAQGKRRSEAVPEFDVEATLRKVRAVGQSPMTGTEDDEANSGSSATTPGQVDPGEWLRQQRVAAGLTQVKLAKRSGVSVRAIADLERGLSRKPDPSSISSLVRALGLPEAAGRIWSRGTPVGGGAGQAAPDADKATISWVVHGKVTVVGVPDRVGAAAGIFGIVAEAGVNIDTIVQNVSATATGRTDISFTLPGADGPRTLEVLRAAQENVGFQDVLYDDRIGKVSLIGAGMRSQPGVSSKFFGALAEAGVNIQMITTSEIRISVVVSPLVQRFDGRHRSGRVGYGRRACGHLRRLRATDDHHEQLIL